MSSPGKTIRTPTFSSSPTAQSADLQDDFQAFQLRPVIRDFKLLGELFASDGDIVFICGRGNQEKQGMLLVSYEIPSTTVSFTASIRLLKVIRLTKRSVTQLETIPILKIVLLLGDGILTLLDIDSLAEIANVSTNNVILFSTWYNIQPNSSGSSTASDNSIQIPNEMRIVVATKRRSLFFHRWLPQQRRLEENKDLRGGFDLLDIPRAIALSSDKICIGYKKSYIIMSLSDGNIIKELTFSTLNEPVINCLQDRTQWCVQMDAGTVFLDSNFEPLYENGITWKDTPSAIIQASPYVLALLNQSIDVCTFNGSQSVPVQHIKHGKSSTTPSKSRLWMDARTERIYTATPTDVHILEPISVNIQLQNYKGMYRYDLALILIRAVLGTSVSSSIHDQSRTNEGHAKGNLDTSTMPKIVTFENNEQISNKSLDNSTSSSVSTYETLNNNQNLDKTTLWNEYYRVGTMHAFQLFHKQQFEQAFAEFNEFLTDPAEIISLFSSLSANTWLTNSYNDFNGFIKQHRHFSEPNDFVGVRLENALHELQRYLTDLRRVFQTIFRRSSNSWLEVQSLVKNRLILKPVRDLLIIVETALLKTYLIDNNNILANALLRNPDNCCLPLEIEKELKKYHRRSELVSFYEKQNRHNEALELISNTDTLATRENILNYLSKLDNNQLELIFKYIRPMLTAALKQSDNNNILQDILTVFIGEQVPVSPLANDTFENRTVKLDPTQVFEFLKEIDQDFAITYLEKICSSVDLGSKQREIHNQIVFAYCDRIKQLSKELKTMRNANQQERKHEIYQDNDIAANQGTSVTKENNPAIQSIKKQKDDYENQLKLFLFNPKCQCDFEKLESYFIQEQKNSSNEALFSLHYGIVLGKLGHHEDALKIFLRDGYYTDAEEYCKTLYSNGQTQIARDLYLQLLKHYLEKSKEGNLNETSLKTILRIVNDAAERLDPVQVLEILPGQLKLNYTKDFIEHALQTCSTNKRSSQLERNLLFLKLLRTHSKRISEENHSFLIDPGSTCARTDCKQPFSATQAVVRFPNNKLVHLHCRAKYENESQKRK